KLVEGSAERRIVEILRATEPAVDVVHARERVEEVDRLHELAVLVEPHFRVGLVDRDGQLNEPVRLETRLSDEMRLEKRQLVAPLEPREHDRGTRERVARSSERR